MSDTNFIPGQTIVDIRDELKLNRGEYTERIGTSRNTLKKWEEEGLSSFSSAAERNMKNIYKLYSTNIVDESLTKIDSSEHKVEIMFALSTIVGIAISIDVKLINLMISKTKEGLEEVVLRRISEEKTNISNSPKGFISYAGSLGLANVIALMEAAKEIKSAPQVDKLDQNDIYKWFTENFFPDSEK